MDPIDIFQRELDYKSNNERQRKSSYTKSPRDAGTVSPKSRSRHSASVSSERSITPSLDVKHKNNSRSRSMSKNRDHSRGRKGR